MREQDEHSVSLLCIFLEDDTKHCFFELLIFYFIIHRYTNRSLNAWLAQNFSKSNTKWEHPALDEMDTPQKAKQDKVGLLHWVVGEAFGICSAQKTAAKEDGNNWGTGTVFRDTTFLLFWKGEVLKTDSPLYLRAPTLNTQISLASEMRFCPFLFLEEVTEICCLYRETTKANFSAQEPPGRLKKTKIPTKLPQAPITETIWKFFSAQKIFGSFSHLEIYV